LSFDTNYYCKYYFIKVIELTLKICPIH
jgi:hypothetical protein